MLISLSFQSYLQIGVMVMVHGDDKGLVMPPKVASVQIIVVPVPFKDADTQAIFDACDATVNTLNEAGFRAEADLRDNYSPGWKYSHWEMKGVPLRIEIGPKDLANKQVWEIQLLFLFPFNQFVSSLHYRVCSVLYGISISLLLLIYWKNDIFCSIHRRVLFAVTIQLKSIFLLSIWLNK